MTVKSQKSTILVDRAYRVENIRRCDLAGELWGQHQGFNDFRM